jgi:ABC-type antimicrobial peptide transport system permease subunit
MVDYLGANADYFETFGITLREGRTFTANDGEGSARVAVVDELLARQAWPGKDPLGQHIGVGPTFYTVVGVVASTRYRDLLAPRATLYTPFTQSALLQQYVAIRTSGSPAAVIRAVRAAVRNNDPRLYLADFATMTDRVDASLATQRVSEILLTTFALSILLLTGVGLYSIAAAFVRQREFEIGIRMALGATPGQVGRFVLRQGAFVMVAGVAAGVLLVLAFSQFVQSIAYASNGRDPMAVVAAVGAVCVVAAAAFMVPARRAARSNPADVLRSD